ncbi:MAG: hypothetical protein [Wendovervirus sonii]|uniref:Uncharacterized protein n=1 Tax=phage Lak_Megaphage_Sonny TaxID=3109229 RepID=A0ABZ0Z642_9CAUD|nr:MAG: hypothetical protein [phage Lak_Megaphage_Sonny]
MTEFFLNQKSREIVFLRIAIEDALASVKAFNITNKKAVDNFMAEVIRQAQQFNNEHNPFYNKAASFIKGKFSSYEINSSTDLVNALVKNRQGMRKQMHLQLLYTRTKKIKDNTVVKVKKYTSDKGLDIERTIAMRSQFGGYQVLFYPFNGTLGKATAHQLNQLKLDYHYTTGCPYYQARPILLSTWQNLDEEHQNASSC